jgi:hypothetical protein
MSKNVHLSGLATIASLLVHGFCPEGAMCWRVGPIDDLVAVAVDREQGLFVSRMRNGLESMRGDLTRLESRARSKGPGAVTALGEPMRTFRAAAEIVDANLDRIRSMREDEWRALKEPTEHAMNDATEALAAAVRAVDNAPSQGRVPR